MAVQQTLPVGQEDQVVILPVDGICHLHKGVRRPRADLAGCLLSDRVAALTKPRGEDDLELGLSFAYAPATKNALSALTGGLS